MSVLAVEPGKARFLKTGHMFWPEKPIRKGRISTLNIALCAQKQAEEDDVSRILISGLVYF